MILLNGKLMDDGEALVSPLAPGFMFGVGAFTTVRVREGRAEFLTLHVERLVSDAGALGLAPASDVATVRARCEVCIAANAIRDGGIKIVWFADEKGGTSEMICQRPHSYTAGTLTKGLRLKVLPCAPRSNRALSRHKTLNYLEHLRGKREAVAAGFDDGLWVDESGTVLEGATCNVFAVIAGEIVTPGLDAGLLPGVARRVILELSDFRVREIRLTQAMLAEAQEVFVANALMGIAPVVAVDARMYALDESGMTRRLQAAFARAAAVT
jgi:branched-subunit amino acid aminotransferase/4-amino-4-deoxychorismate lyase